MSLCITFTHRIAAMGFAVGIEAPTPGVTVLFGPSGSGKSTIAAVAAGLLRPQTGRVVVDDVVLTDTASGRFVPPERRGVGVVFQDGRLFPHFSVAGNLAYGQRRSRAGGRSSIGWDAVVGLLGLEHLLARRPVDLSGGERQRVAIGRALLCQPRLLIMDEPLAGLDGRRRREILPFLAALVRAAGLPILYVTHAADEVARLADTLVLIEDGRSTAAGPVSEIAGRADLPLAMADDAAAVLDCTVEAHLPKRGLTRIAVQNGEGAALLVPTLVASLGARVRVRVPAADVIIACETPQAISVQNVLPARIVAMVPDAQRAAIVVELRLGEAPLLARLTPDAAARLGLAVSQGVLALIKSVSVQVV